MRFLRFLKVPTGIFLVVDALYARPGGLVNSSFDDGGSQGWSLSSDMTIGRGFGHNGSGGLKWENDRPSQAQGSATQTVAFKVGMEYSFSALIRTESFKAQNKGATVCVEWYDAKDKWIGGGYVMGGWTVAENSDWTLVRGVTREIPSNTVKVVVMLYVGKGSSGKVFFDNVRFEPLLRAPVAFVFSSAYRNVAADGEVRFHASLYRPKGEKGSCSVFAYKDASGRERRVAATREDEDGATLKLPVDELQMGEGEVRCELMSASGKCLGGASCRFARVNELPKRRVWIDSHKRCIVDGKPFFPLGMYGSRFEGELLEVFAKGPFNVVMPYRRATRSDLDLLHSKGLKAFVPLRDELLGTDWAKENGFKSQEQVDDWYRVQIGNYKNHPALLGWYVNDERPVTEVPVRAHLRDVFWKADPDHPTWAVLDRTYDLREFIPTFDVLGMDPYPVNRKPISHVTEMMREVNHAIFSDVALWNVPQAFDWGWFGCNQGQDRFPTERELANMCWQHIAAGANGLISYCYHTLFRYLKDETLRKDYWGRICRVHEGVKQMIPVLLSIESAPELADVPLSMPARIWKKDGRLYVLVVNVENDEQSAKIGFGGGSVRRTVSGIELGAVSRAEITDGKLSVVLPAAGFAIICIVEEGK